MTAAFAVAVACDACPSVVSFDGQRLAVVEHDRACPRLRDAVLRRSGVKVPARPVGEQAGPPREHPWRRWDRPRPVARSGGVS